jgi:hypothetical protein
MVTHQTAAADSLYEVLHVERTATHEDIVRSYRILAAELHPDKQVRRERFSPFARRHEKFLSLRVLMTCLVGGRADNRVAIQKSSGG